MNEITFTLITDGPSDVVLLPILKWLLKQYLPLHAIQPQWADTRPYRCPNLEKKMEIAIRDFPCDLLFVHRDAELMPYPHRYEEIQKAINALGNRINVPVVCVIPVRMQESWLLFDVEAIRWAAGNPNGKLNLQLPVPHQIEQKDTKEILHKLLEDASGLKGRRLDKFNHSYHARRVSDYIEDFTHLRKLSAFRQLEQHLNEILKACGLLS